MFNPRHDVTRTPVPAVAALLTYAGTLPFVFAALHPEAVIGGIGAPTIASAYAVAIISFISGIHWALQLVEKMPRGAGFLVFSNITTLAALSFYLFAPAAVAVSGYIALFLVLLAVDRLALGAEAAPAWFYRLRRNATWIVVLSLAILLWRQHQG